MSASDNKLFDLLKILDENDLEAFEKFPPEEKKKMAPLVIMRWLTGCKNKEQIFAINSFTNPLIFKLYKHPNLLFKTMMVSSTGPKRYSWIAKKTKVYKYPKMLEVMSKAFSCSLRESNDILGRITGQEVMELAMSHGYDVEFLDSLKKEIKQYENI